MAEYERIRALWPDHLGIARGKYLPAAYAAEGTFHCAAVFALGYDKDMTPAPGSFMLDGFPDEHERDRKSTRLNSSHSDRSRMPSSA